MRSLRPALRGALVAATLSAAASPIAAQEPADTLVSADTAAAADTLPPRLPPRPIGDPRLTWLGDTLPPADTLRPRFAVVPVVWPDSLVDPYTLHRPGAWPAWEIRGDALVGRGAYNLLDVLESEAPVLAHDIGGPGSHAWIGSPLGTATNVQVVVDGVPVGSPLEAAWDLRRIPVEGIARVAWWPGAQVAAWGGEGTGGVLEITTRRSLAPVATSTLGFMAGSFDAQAFAGSLGRPVTDRGDVFVAANFDDSEGFVFAGDFTRNQLVAKAGVRLGDAHRFEVARWSDGISGEADRDGLIGEEDRDGFGARLSYMGSLGPLAARVHLHDESRDTRLAFDYRGVPGIIGDGDRSGVRGDVSFRAGPVLAWGAAARERSQVQSLHPAFARPDGSSVFEPPTEPDPDAIVLEDPRRRTEIGGGAGVGRPGDRFAANVAVRRSDWGDAAEAATSWQAEAVARPVEGLRLRVFAGRAFRAPDVAGQAILAAFASGGLEIHPGRAAEPRAPERWTSWRAEASWSRPGWRVAARAFDASGDGAFLWAPPSAWLYVDRGATEVVTLGEIPFNTFDQVDLSMTGFEGEVAMPLPWGLAGVAVVRRLEATEEFTGRPVPYVPETQALGQLRFARRYFPSRDLLVEARLAGRYVGERPSLEAGSLPAYLLGDLLVQGTVVNFTIFVSFRNLAGTAHRHEDDFGLPEREGYLGVVWRFRN